MAVTFSVISHQLILFQILSDYCMYIEYIDVIILIRIIIALICHLKYLTSQGFALFDILSIMLPRLIVSCGMLYDGYLL
jgi:hypothetical protein